MELAVVEPAGVRAVTIDLERPLRNPDLESPPFMAKRARWLVVLGFLIPGTAQLLGGGNRKLGRWGLGSTIALILGIVVLAAGFFVARVPTLTLVSNPWFLLFLQIVVVYFAIMWLVLGLDTLRLLKLVRITPNWRIPVAMLSVLLTVLPVGAAAWAATTIGVTRTAIGDLFQAAPPVEPVNGRYNILLLGADAGADREGLRPDSISLVSVDAESGQSVIIGLPRELIAMPFPEESPLAAVHPNGFGVAPNAFGEWGGCNVGDPPYCRINALYAEMEDFQNADGTESYGQQFYPDAESRGSSPGLEATKDAVTGATGLEVQFYVLVNMDGFSDIIDALGGVTVEVPERLPIGGRIDENTGELVDVDGWIKPGEQKLNGWKAQWFARSRYGSANGDYDRMERQRVLQSAILAQMDPKNVLLRFQEVAKAGTQLVETDIPDSMLGRFVDLAAKARGFDPERVELIPKEGVDADAPDYAVVRELVEKGVAAATPKDEKDAE